MNDRSEQTRLKLFAVLFGFIKNAQYKLMLRDSRRTFVFSKGYVFLHFGLHL